MVENLSATSGRLESAKLLANDAFVDESDDRRCQRLYSSAKGISGEVEILFGDQARVEIIMRTTMYVQQCISPSLSDQQAN